MIDPMEPTDQHSYSFDQPPELPPEELNQVLGGKGANLVVMARQLGLPVPPGFTITTAACREHLAGRWPARLDEELLRQMKRLGEQLGRRFGDPTDPLLVSVRSGAPVSMPGMMDTMLNLGLNEETAAGLARATDNPEFAADCLRRFREGYRAVIGEGDVPEDPWVQLRAAIEAVFRSWNSERAIAYRRREGIADDLGTAVTVQAMVFGNRGPDSATGVLFTRNPSTGERTLYGDVMFEAQGEEVVAGGAATQPIEALGERLPLVAEELRRHATTLERYYADLCDIEFTVEQGRLWMLQVRVGKRSPRAALRMAIEMAQDPEFPVSREEAVRRVLPVLAEQPRVFVRSPDAPAPVAGGLPASPGVATGVVATSSAAAEAAAERGESVILVRAETSPEDVPGMSRSAGVLTALGGLASHAAVVARGWGIPAVVGAAQVRLGQDEAWIGENKVAAGETITIDGSTGEVYLGRLEGEWQVAPEAATLLGWARELGIEVPAAPGADDSGTEAEADPQQAAEPRQAAEPQPAGQPATDITPDDVLRALLIKGSATAEQLTESLMAEPAVVEEHAAALKADGLTDVRAGAWILSAKGKLAGLELFGADRSSVGEDEAVARLEQFHAFDGRMKQVVTDWQLRDVGGEQVLNDHTDAAYDAELLERLAALHRDTAEWLGSLAQRFRRYAAYRSRLGRALEQAQAGDQRFVASPRVDSYHSVWFELHEDLIRLAGRKREE
jgi:pyruvate, orthophosphate dikinase